ncbi:YcfL family protein [Pseudoalteromonas tunicata]|jgi:uncharacterized protein YcfL|uniref:Putative lipoprotein n=1 Tax=Pseudoalteromonas tunicata D2 TaxID=87626 RepID=A4C3X6_9GAMM|nr:YcfL family protein [Pseudoalteromonas tunicata]ATC97257.1 hypothetical protein PTUN_b0942 [Pseudoalteromonas tunicata]AXT33339.1 DUF1425 domain-containing protein [Pseudoalteromonas tunicata]EAR30258.1 putative lipoprotein [Pseudoalteromonas tunicata D2]MDP4984176.1 YcfL family protein [Pseudoalteromonas tunicata]MDP5214435.1 YcfL family protein [Pseudoalteromonas tunicata]
MKQFTLVKLSSVIIFAIALSGCVHNPITTGIGTKTISVNQKMLDETSLQNYIEVDNSRLAGRLHISQILTRKQNDYLNVAVQIKSDYHKSQKLQYRISWFDQQGFEIEPNSQNWQPIDLHGGQNKELLGLAQNTQANSFKFYIREVATQLQRF